MEEFLILKLGNERRREYKYNNNNSSNNLLTLKLCTKLEQFFRSWNKINNNIVIIMRINHKYTKISCLL